MKKRSENCPSRFQGRPSLAGLGLASLTTLLAHAVFIGCSQTTSEPPAPPTVSKPSDASASKPGGAPAKRPSDASASKPGDAATKFRKELFDSAFRQALRFNNSAPTRNSELRVELKVLEPAVNSPEEKACLALLSLVADAQDAMILLESAAEFSEKATAALVEAGNNSDKTREGFEIIKRVDPERAEQLKSQLEAALLRLSEISLQWTQGNAVLKIQVPDKDGGTEFDASLIAEKFDVEAIKGKYATYMNVSAAKKKIAAISTATLDTFGKLINNGGKVKE